LPVLPEFAVLKSIQSYRSLIFGAGLVFTSAESSAELIANMERLGLSVRLTTAATIFVTASVGMAVGGGLFLTAIFATVIALVALAIFGRLEIAFDSSQKD
jgi:MgtC family